MHFKRGPFSKKPPRARGGCWPEKFTKGSRENKMGGGGGGGGGGTRGGGN